MFNVENIESHPVLNIRQSCYLTSVTLNLAQSRNARLNKVALHISVHHLRKFVSVFHHVRARTDDTHVAQQHIDELRCLVEVGLAHKESPLCNASVPVGRLSLIALFVVAHRAELYALEYFSVQSRALLNEENLTWHGTFCHYEDQYQYKRKNETQKSQREKNVETSFQKPVFP
jgi:hypothetical protein